MLMLKRMIVNALHIETRPLEISTAVQSILWGTWLLLPFQTFGSSPVFSVMAVVAPEQVWGVLALASGVFQLVAAHTKRLKWRWYATCLTLFLWMFIDVAFWLTQSYSTASVANLVFVVMSGWALIALSSNGVYEPK